MFKGGDPAGYIYSFRQCEVHLSSALEHPSDKARPPPIHYEDSIYGKGLLTCRFSAKMAKKLSTI